MKMRRSSCFALALALCACGAPAEEDSRGASASPTARQAGGTPAAPARDVSASHAAAPASAMPERFRRGLERAWSAAEAGKDPNMACTGVIARAAGNPPADGIIQDDAVLAFERCYVDVRERYIRVLLSTGRHDGVGDDATVCAAILSNRMIARASLASFAANVGLDADALDQRVAERVVPEMRSRCPDQADLMAPG